MVDLPAPERPVNHRTVGRWPALRPRADLGHVERLPMHVGGAAQGEIDEPHADRVVGEAVDDDEAAKLAVLVIGRKGDRRAEIEIAHADLVERQRLGRHMFERVDVDLVFGAFERAVDGAGADLDEIGAAGQHRLIAHPQDARLELVGRTDRIAAGAENIAAADIDFIVERDGDRLAGDRHCRDRRRRSRSGRRGWCGPRA